MKIRVTEIEATAAELRASNDLGSSLVSILRTALNRLRYEDEEPDEPEDPEEGEG